MTFSQCIFMAGYAVEFVKLQLPDSEEQQTCLRRGATKQIATEDTKEKAPQIMEVCEFLH